MFWKYFFNLTTNMKSIAIIVIILLTGFWARSQADIAVSSANVTPAPITVATGISVSFTVYNMGSSPATPSGMAIRLQVGLLQVAPSATFNINTDITGTGIGNNLLTWTYNSTNNEFIGQLNQTFPATPDPLDSSVITINNLISTGLSTSSFPGNGLNVNVLVVPAFNADLSNDNTFAYTSSTATLPVTLVDFSATKQNGAALLNWTTSSEVNAKDYEIEHSTNGNRYLQIGTVTAAGNSNVTLKYNFTDNAPAAGANYYRLKMVNDDGSFAYSPIQILNFGSTGIIIVYPNPAQDNINVTGVETGMQLRVVSTDGRILSTKIARGNTEKIFIDQLSKGIYFLQVIKNETLFGTSKFTHL
jgi:hypothetical protein